MLSMLRETSGTDVPETEKLISYKNTVLKQLYLPVADLIENFEVRDDDIWLCGFPKSGTTWCQEMIWNIANDLNFEASKIDIDKRFPYFEYSGLNAFGAITESENNSNALPRLIWSKLSSPRFIKTHLPFHLLPRQLRNNEKKAKIVCVWRNPKDVCISFYHFQTMKNVYNGNFSNYCELFLNDAVHCGSYWDHVIGFWDRRHDENILLLKYEDMKADLGSEIKKTANFLGKNLNSDQITKLEKHLSFENMSTNPAVLHSAMAEVRKWKTEMKFMRKGEAGQWKTELSSEMVAKFDSWTCEKLKNNKSLLREVL